MSMLHKIIAAIFVTLVAFFALEATTAGGLEHTPAKNGLYLAGDIGGVTFQHVSNFSSTSIGFLVPANIGQLSDINAANALNFSWSAGIGWSLNSLFRIDVTYTYFRIPLEFPTVVVAGNFLFNTSLGKVNASSTIYLFNAYLNLAVLFHHMTALLQPYIGAGIGAARNRLKDMAVTTNTVPPITILVDASKRTDFAYQLIFGVQYRLMRQFLLYAQYSYMNLGKYLIGPGTSLPGAFNSNPRFHAYSNRFSVGLRYVF